MILSIIQILLTIGCLLGSYLNCRKAKACFIIWLISNSGWVCVDLVSGTYSRILLDLIYLAFNIYGLLQWNKKSDNSNKEETNYEIE